MNLLNYIQSILISLLVGLAGFVLAYKIFDWLSPRIDFEESLNKGNLAVAVFLAGLFIGLGLLLGSAVK
jgi:putative membrane protein